MAAHGTSYPPGQLHCARLVHIPQSSEHLQGWRVLGASRRLPRQPPSPALPPPPLLAGGTRGAAATTGPTAGSAAAPSPSGSASAPAALGTARSQGQGLVSLLPDLSRGAEDQGWDTGGQSAGDERESRPSQLGSSHPGTNLGRETGTVHTLSPPDQLLQLPGPEAPLDHRHILALQVIDRVQGGGSRGVRLSQS